MHLYLNNRSGFFGAACFLLRLPWFATCIDSLWTKCQSECSRTTKAGAYRFQSRSPWECTLLYGRPTTGPREEGSKRSIGARPLFMLIIRISTSRAVPNLARQTAIQTQTTGGRAQHTVSSVQYKLGIIGGFVWTTWSMTTALISPDTRSPRRNAPPEFEALSMKTLDARCTYIVC